LIKSKRNIYAMVT